MKQFFNKLKEINETLLVCLIILIGVFVMFIFYGSKKNEELCKEGSFAPPLEQEVAYDNEIRKNEFVQYLRKALDSSIAGDNFDLTNYSDYIKGKFIVLATSTAPGGGSSIILMFKDKPDKVFYAWVYDYLDGKYDLRGFMEYDLAKNEAPNIQETQKSFINQLCDKDFGL